MRPGASPSQNGTAGGAPSRVVDPDHARLDPADPPRVGAEQEHVAGHGLDGPVLVDGADQGVVRLGQHPVVAELRDRPARGERGDPGARGGRAAGRSPGRGAGRRRGGRGRCGCPRETSSATSSKSSRDSPANGAARRTSASRSSSAQSAAAHSATICWARMSSGPSGTISASSRRPAPPRSSAAHSTSSSRDVGYSRPVGRAGPGVVGPAHPLQERGEAARRADLAHQLDRADVDAQLQRRGGDQGPQVAGPQPRLDPLPPVLGQAAVVRRRPGRRRAARRAGARPARPSAGC